MGGKGVIYGEAAIDLREEKNQGVLCMQAGFTTKTLKRSPLESASRKNGSGLVKELYPKKSSESEAVRILKQWPKGV